MPTADLLELDPGDPVFQTTFRAFSEGHDNNGILDGGDLEITAGSGTNTLDVAATNRGLVYNGSVYTYGGGTDVLTLSANTSGDPRWDLIYFDTATSSPGKREGTPATKPQVPALQGDEFLLGYVRVPDGETNVVDSQIKNLRVHAKAATGVHLTDSGGEFSSDFVEGALTEVIRESGDDLTGPLDLSSFSGSAPFDLGTNPGGFGAIVDSTVDSNSTAGTAHTYAFSIDGTTHLRTYTESDGSGGIQNSRIEIQNADLRLDNTQAVEWSTVKLYEDSVNHLKIETSGGGSGEIQLYDANVGQELLTALEGGEIKIPSGPVTLSADNGVIWPSGSQIFEGSGGSLNIDSSGDGGDQIRLRDGTSSDTLFAITENGPVEILLTDLHIPDGDIQSGDSNGALELDERSSVADAGKVALSRDDAVQGYAMIQDVTNNVSCMVYLGGDANTVEIIHDSGSSNNFTTTEGNDGTTNVYWDSTNARYELNNETGASATYGVEVLKA